MRLSLSQLEAFYWTVELGSARLAAEHLDVAQPTISMRLRDMAAALGAPVLERAGRTLRPTAEGRALLPRVAAVMAELRGMADVAGDQPIAGPIRVGLAEGFAVTVLPPLHAALLDAHPALRPEWVVTTSMTLEAALVRDALDLAVLLNPAGAEGLRLMPLGAQPTSWVVPASWGLSGPITPRDLAALPVITNPAPSAMYRQITGWFATAALEPQRLSACSSVALIGELVAGGIGAGLLPVPMAARYVAQGTACVVVSDPPVQNGRLFLCDRIGSKDSRRLALTRILGQVLDTLCYLEP